VHRRNLKQNNLTGPSVALETAENRRGREPNSSTSRRFGSAGVPAGIRRPKNLP